MIRIVIIWWKHVNVEALIEQSRNFHVDESHCKQKNIKKNDLAIWSPGKLPQNYGWKRRKVWPGLWVFHASVDLLKGAVLGEDVEIVGEKQSGDILAVSNLYHKNMKPSCGFWGNCGAEDGNIYKFQSYSILWQKVNHQNWKIAEICQLLLEPLLTKLLVCGRIAFIGTSWWLSSDSHDLDI